MTGQASGARLDACFQSRKGAGMMGAARELYWLHPFPPRPESR